MSLTSSSEFTVQDSAVEVAQVRLHILPLAAPGEGTGRLVHPSLGVYDYALSPEKWTNMDGNAIIAPLWVSERTLSGQANTYWQGHLQDVVVQERWLGRRGAAMPFDQLRVFIGMYQNPPSPEEGFVHWAPSYVNAHTYEVILENLEVGQGGIELSMLALKQGLVEDPVTLTLRLVRLISPED